MEEILRNRIVVRYNEIFLKGQNRAFFEKKLAHNIKACLKKHDVKYDEVKRFRGRIIISFSFDISGKCDCLKKVFGIASFSTAIEMKAEEEKDVETMKHKALELLREKGIDSEKSFRIVAKRSDKNFPMDSHTINEIIGSYVQTNTNARVQLQNPDLYVGIEIMNKSAYLFTEKIKGPNGLPIGTEGKVICLLSGGIDSPVAAWLMMRRGCQIALLYIDNTPFVDDAHIQRAKDIADKLSEYYLGDKLKLYIAKNGKGMSAFKEINDKYTCLFCKRMMMRIASEIAKKENAEAIVDGSSLAQVASQTISNMSVINEAASIFVLRPLIGMDKNGIIDFAKKIGTFDISVGKTSGCMAVPKHPATHSELKKMKFLESKININKIVEDSIRELEIIHIN